MQNVIHKIKKKKNKKYDTGDTLDTGRKLISNKSSMP